MEFLEHKDFMFLILILVFLTSENCSLLWGLKFSYLGLSNFLNETHREIELKLVA